MADRKVPKIAIITRTKDRLNFLERALESVEKQTYKDYIHVIFNDGGDKKKLEDVLRKYPNKKRLVIHSDNSVGMYNATNKAIKASKSKYITILDDDDSWPPRRLEKTVKYLEETGENVVVVKMNIVEEEIVGGGKFKTVSQYLHPESGEGEISLFKQCHKNYLSDGIITYRREVFDELGGYDGNLPAAADWDFGIRLMLKYDVAFLRDEEPLFFYHQRPSQSGIAGNSVFESVSKQEKAIAILRNRYLRKDIVSGKFGVGYIMNSLEHDKELVIRLESHVNYAAQQHEERIVQTITKQIDKSFNRLISHRIYKRIRTATGKDK